MASHWLRNTTGELIPQGRNGFVGEPPRHLIDEMDECAAGAAVEGVHPLTVGTLADVVVVVVGDGPYLGVGLLLHHGGEVGAEGVQDLGVGEAELAVAHPLAANLGEPLGMAVEVGGRRNEFLEGVYIHTVGPSERSGGLVVIDILAVRTYTDAAMEGMPVGIGGAVMWGVVPYLAIGEGGVVHLVHDRKAGVYVGSHIGYLVVCHAVALQLQKAASTIVDRHVPAAIDEG